MVDHTAWILEATEAHCQGEESHGSVRVMARDEACGYEENPRAEGT